MIWYRRRLSSLDADDSKDGRRKEKKEDGTMAMLGLAPPPSLCHQSRPSVRKSVLRLAPLLVHVTFLDSSLGPGV